MRSLGLFQGWVFNRGGFPLCIIPQSPHWLTLPSMHVPGAPWGALLGIPAPEDGMSLLRDCQELP